MKHTYDAPDFARHPSQWDSTDIAAHARRAEHLTPEDMPMRMTTVDYSWRHQPRKSHPEKRGVEGGLIMLLVGMIGVLLALMVAHVAVKAIANLAAFNGGL